MKRYLLGIDAGTTGTKSVLFSEDGEIGGKAYKAYPSFSPAPEAREQNAEDVWDAVCETAKDACKDHAGEVVAVSLSSQGGTLIPVSRDYSPVRRAVLWSDGSCEREKKLFLDKYGADLMYKKTGWKLSPRFLPMEIRRLKDTEGLDAAYYLSVPSFIAAKMTGIPAVDLSSAGIEQTVDITKGEYDGTLLSFAGVTESELAVIVPSGRAVGPLCRDAAERIGIGADTVFVSGAHDQYASLLGSGACAPGDVMLGTGTAWAAVALSDKLDFSSGIPQSVAAAKGSYGRLLSVSSGGVCLEWLRSNMLGDISYREIDTECEKRRAAECGLFFLPDKNKTFYGLSLSHDRFDLARAVMEGVAFAARNRLERLGCDPKEIRFTGGASKSPFWSRLTADVIGLPLVIPDINDTACLGAAVLAGVGSGVFSDAAEGCARLSTEEKRVLPDAERVKIYNEAYKKYCDIAGRL